MDGSSIGNMNTSHMPRPDPTSNDFGINSGFLGGIHNYPDPSDVTVGNDDLSNFLHPDLLVEQTDAGTGTQQHSHQHPFQSHFDQQRLPLLVPVRTQSQTQKKAAPAETVKRPRGRPRKDGQPVSQTVDKGSGSDSELEILHEPEPRPSVLTVSMPTEFRSQSLYKVVDAVWCDRNNPAPLDKIKSGVNDFGTVVKAFRDSWKDKNEKLKKAEIEGSPTASDAPRLKKDVSDDRTYMGLLMDRALKFGHPAVLKSLGENHWTMSALYSFMLDRVSAGDLDSPLIASILKLAVNFNTLDDAKLETVKWTKILQRLTKKSTGEAKELARKIIANAAALTAKKQTEGARSSPGVNGDAQAGVKRSRDAEGGQLPPRKTVVKPSSKPLALQNAERRRVLEREETAKRARESKEANSTPASAVSKPKVTLPAKSNAIASLMSASKKPGTSNAERAAAAKDKAAGAAPIKKEAAKRDSPPRPTSASTRVQPSFMGILSDINNKKKDVKSAAAEEFANETPEQKARRLRKEARRKLRVSWKADSELVETRLFTHDPDEEIGLEGSLMKDAGDTMSEGEMLKRKMAMTDLDEEEEEDDLFDDSYSPPSEVDFSPILERDPSADMTSNGIKYGGPVKPDSPSKVAQDQFEASTLMVVFDGKSDRPATPKEAPEDGDDDNFQPCVDFGDPEGKVRQREREILQKRQALAASATPVAPSFDLLAQQQAQPAAAVGPAFGSNLAALVDSVHQAQQRAQSYSLPATQPAGPPAGQIDFAAILAAASQQSKYGKHGLDDNDDSTEKKKVRYPPNYKTQPFQTGEVGTFLAHIRAGLDTLKTHHPSALLCFSGGSTKPRLTARSEAEGHAFKRRRFLDLHLRALRWTGEVEYIGIDPLLDDDGDDGKQRMAEIIRGDQLNGYGAWKDDLYGQGPRLRAKREQRGWSEDEFLSALIVEGEAEGKDVNGQKRTINVGTDDIRADLIDLVKWQDPRAVFPRRLPWERDGERDEEQSNRPAESRSS
ncbi:hypothetical protein DV735_g4157, partial [Chaetothyriales sp. CBS 134920]